MTRRWRTCAAWIVALFMLGSAAGLAVAEDGDPPGRAARVSDAEGAVSLQPAGVQDWTAAMVNRPLTTGDRVWSDQGSRAELDLGTAAIRLGSNTGFAFLNLDDRSVQMQLSAGALIVSVRDMPNGESYEVDTPNIALSLQQPGVYRIEVDDQGTATAVAVSQGAAQASGGGQTIAIGSQQVVTFGGADTLAWQSSTLGAPDEFDDWSALREREAAQSASSGYVASDIPGTQDLDNNGEWQQTPEYGYVWVPTVVAASWVPYRYGQWVWVTPWGWTWVDAAPWGYAPFHYGRWVVWNRSWCWVPAPKHGGRGRAVYSPALVAWVGAVPGGGFAPASHVGWFPLGPREVYVPPYRVSTSYVRNVNITNTVINNTYITRVYEDSITPQHYVNNTANGVTIVARSTFTSGQRVGAHTVEPSAPTATAVTAAGPGVVPTRQSVLGVSAAHSVARPPGSLMQRALITRSAPPPAPVPFERQLSAIEAAGGRPPTRSELSLLQHGASLTPVKGVSSRATSLPRARVQEIAAMQSLAEREKALQQSAFPSSPRRNAPPAPASTSRSGSAVAEELPLSPSTPVLRSDRPPSAQQHAAAAEQRAIHPPETAQASEPPAIPVYQVPSSAAPPPQAPVARPAEMYRVAPPAASPPPPAAPHLTVPVPGPPPAHPPSSPTHAQSSQEPRDSAAHADRDSRDRATR